MTDTYMGHCQCSAIEYQFLGEPSTVHACHCTDCQKRSGSAFGLTMVVSRGSFTINGEVASYIRTSDIGQKNTSCFCPKCGNHIYGKLEQFPSIIAIRPGTLDDTKWFTLEQHIWTNSAQSWFQFPEGCKTLPKGRR